MGSGQNSAGGCSPNIAGGISGSVSIQCPASTSSGYPTARLAQAYNKACRRFIVTDNLIPVPDSFLDQALGSVPPKLQWLASRDCYWGMDILLRTMKPREFNALIVFLDAMNTRLDAISGTPTAKAREDLADVSLDVAPEVRAALDSRDLADFNANLDKYRECLDGECSVKSAVDTFDIWFNANMDAGYIDDLGDGEITARSAPPSESDNGVYELSLVVRAQQNEYHIQQTAFWSKSIDDDCFSVGKKVFLIGRRSNARVYAVPQDLNLLFKHMNEEGYLLLHAPLGARPSN